jgi:Tfp pilus assembly protein PilN
VSAPTERKATPGKGVPMAPGYVAPRVNLLPPEIYGSRAMSRLKRMLALSLVLVLAVCAGGYALFSFARSAQQDALADAEAETIRLTQEQAQYAEVPKVLGRLGDMERARDLGMSTETLWGDYLGYVFSVLPQGVRMASFTTVGATPVLSPAAPADPLQPQAVTQISFTAQSDTLPNLADWQDALDAIPAFEDARVSVITRGEDDDTKTGRFEFEVSVQVTDQAYANRFAPVEGEEG